MRRFLAQRSSPAELAAVPALTAMALVAIGVLLMGRDLGGVLAVGLGAYLTLKAWTAFLCGLGRVANPEPTDPRRSFDPISHGAARL